MADMKRNNIEQVVNQFIIHREPLHRYTSFDYSYNYFRITNDLTIDIEKLLGTWFFLASWGMLRASSFLLQNSVKRYQSTIEYIARLDKSIWKISIDKYGENGNIEKIIEVYNKIKESCIVHHRISHKILVSKILLGVFGFIPAFDKYFSNTFRGIANRECCFTSVSIRSLTFLYEFYLANQAIIDKLSDSTFTIDFKTGVKTNIKYPKAKIIDMYGFSLNNPDL